MGVWGDAWSGLKRGGAAVLTLGGSEAARLQNKAIERAAKGSTAAAGRYAGQLGDIRRGLPEQEGRIRGLYGGARQTAYDYSRRQPRQVQQRYAGFQQGQGQAQRGLTDPGLTGEGELERLRNARGTVGAFGQYAQDAERRLGQQGTAYGRYLNERENPAQFQINELIQGRAAGQGQLADAARRRQTQPNVMQGFAQRQQAAAERGIPVPELDALGGLQSSTGEAFRRATELSRGPAYQEKYFGGLEGQLGQQGAAESFYAQQLPEVLQGQDYFAKRFLEDQQKMAAAQGRLASGYTGQNIGEQMAGLRARQMRELGDLAGQAQQLQLQRFGTGGELAAGADIGQMARQQALLDAGEAENRFGLQRADIGIRGRLGAEGVKTGRLGLAQEAQFKLADIAEQKQAALDRFAQQGSAENLAAVQEADRAAARERARIDALSATASQEGIQREELRGGIARGVSQEQAGQQMRDQQLAGMIAGNQLQKAQAVQGIRQYVDSRGDRLAGAAGAEADRNFKTIMQTQMGLNAAEANIMMNFAKMGVDLATQEGRAAFDAAINRHRMDMQRANNTANMINQSANRLLQVGGMMYMGGAFSGAPAPAAAAGGGAAAAAAPAVNPTPQYSTGGVGAGLVPR